MKRLIDAVAGIAQALDRHDRQWVLIGGLAVSALTEPRFTRDVDLAVIVDSDRDAEALIRSLRADGYELLALVEQEAVDRLATVRLRAPTEDPAGVVVDLLFASSGIEAEIVRAAGRAVIFTGVEVPLPAIGHLIALKVLSESERRLKDRQDLIALIGAADERELERAREAVELITVRGFNRGRVLSVALAEWIERVRAG